MRGEQHGGIIHDHLLGLLIHGDAFGHILFHAGLFEKRIQLRVGVAAIDFDLSRCGKGHPQNFQGRDNRRTNRR